MALCDFSTDRKKYVLLYAYRSIALLVLLSLLHFLSNWLNFFWRNCTGRNLSRLYLLDKHVPKVDGFRDTLINPA